MWWDYQDAVRRLGSRRDARTGDEWRRHGWPSLMLAHPRGWDRNQLVRKLWLARSRRHWPKRLDRSLRMIALLMREPGPPVHAQVEGFAHFCPACGAPTLRRRFDYEICMVCWWEDDDTVGDAPDAPSPTNHGQTLVQWRARLADHGPIFAEYEDQGCEAGEVAEHRSLDPARLAAKAELLSIGAELRSGTVPVERLAALRPRAEAALDFLSRSISGGSPSNLPAEPD